MALGRFCSGVVPYGSYFDHVLGYWKESLERPKKVFFISYEELKDDPKTHVKRLAEFLGCPFNGEDEEQEVEEIARNCSFDRLSNLEVNKSSDCPTWLKLPYSSYFRQSGMGDHKNYLDPEMIKRIDTITRPEKSIVVNVDCDMYNGAEQEQEQAHFQLLLSTTSFAFTREHANSLEAATSFLGFFLLDLSLPS
ncbi:hypothetical protein HHK36_029891 [Tetracentron sinense]|uniref:Sulfotransferase n=1 Tax=Tetracentron sinense TaxID=13715 RepID=A0A834YAC1_TETSI|nr:hypothetical protein HHK36_029891 [Tetracentron sinense]